MDIYFVIEVYIFPLCIEVCWWLLFFHLSTLFCCGGLLVQWSSWEYFWQFFSVLEVCSYIIYSQLHF